MLLLDSGEDVDAVEEDEWGESRGTYQGCDGQNQSYRRISEQLREGPHAAAAPSLFFPLFLPYCKTGITNVIFEFFSIELISVINF